ncbi:hypothetical protein, partial [Streptomyces sp. IBSBF 2390]|uniref:hypothetical protein n=1 Tax=Streptomyces sp. IBSBF 2390 TaxID=2903533 RepID=UPI002FDBA246
MNRPSYRDRTGATSPPRLPGHAGNVRRLSTTAVAAMLLAGCAAGTPDAAPRSSGPGLSHT